MTHKAHVMGVYCDEAGCKIFTEFSMDSDRPIGDRLRSSGWGKNLGGGDLCPECLVKRKAKEKADAQK